MRLHEHRYNVRCFCRTSISHSHTVSTSVQHFKRNILSCAIEGAYERNKPPYATTADEAELESEVTSCGGGLHGLLNYRRPLNEVGNRGLRWLVKELSNVDGKSSHYGRSRRRWCGHPNDQWAQSNIPSSLIRLIRLPRRHTQLVCCNGGNITI